MKVITVTSLIMWIIIGLINLVSPDQITKWEYGIVWILLILEIICDCLE